MGVCIFSNMLCFRLGLLNWLLDLGGGNFQVDVILNLGLCGNCNWSRYWDDRGRDWSCSDRGRLWDHFLVLVGFFWGY